MVCESDGKVMFTGIITHISRVLEHKSAAEGLTLTFERPAAWTDLALGESIATNGVCLTVSAMREDSYDCFLMPETLAVSAFGKELPSRVNLERSLGLNDRFGGHFVQGHVDSVGKVVKIDDAHGYEMSVEFPAGSEDLVIYKGSITINGVSLTVAGVEGKVLRVALIPHTLEQTTLGALRVGDAVNLEFDMLAKHIAKIMENRQKHAEG
jgi:riboflavin synthase